MEREPLSVRAQGRWRGILGALGVGSHYLTGKHGPCPMCGGKDRWRFTDKDGAGRWICNQCGNGDGAELVKRLRHVDFKEAAVIIEGVIGSSRREEPKQRLTENEAKAKMRSLWTRGHPLTPESFAGCYLASRGIIRKVFPAALRIAESPLMMLAKVVSPDGRAVNVHRTFLTADGRKADRERPKLMMEGTTPAGSAVRLSAITDGWLGVAEAIENAFSAETLFNLPATPWAACSADSLAAFIAPEGTERLVIFADSDANYHGQSAAMTCARANTAKGIKVEVKIPDSPGQDWNDMLAKQNLRGVKNA